jgi:hypothetical protein
MELEKVLRPRNAALTGDTLPAESQVRPQKTTRTNPMPDSTLKNGLLIEFGFDQGLSEDIANTFKKLMGSVEAMKAEKLIGDYQYHTLGTGNRKLRASMLMLEGSSEQIEALVAHPAYYEFGDRLMNFATNVTINRSINLARTLEMIAR